MYENIKILGYEEDGTSTATACLWQSTAYGREREYAGVWN